MQYLQVCEPCIKACFKQREAGALVERGAHILYLLLDSEVPGCELAPITPSFLNLGDPHHRSTFLKYFNILVRLGWCYVCDN